VHLSRRIFFVVFVDVFGIGITHSELVKQCGGKTEGGSVHGCVRRNFFWDSDAIRVAFAERNARENNERNDSQNNVR